MFLFWPHTDLWQQQSTNISGLYNIFVFCKNSMCFLSYMFGFFLWRFFVLWSYMFVCFFLVKILYVSGARFMFLKLLCVSGATCFSFFCKDYLCFQSYKKKNYYVKDYLVGCWHRKTLQKRWQVMSFIYFFWPKSHSPFNKQKGEHYTSMCSSSYCFD